MKNLDDILKMAGNVQAELQKAQAQLDHIEVEGVSGGGLVKVLSCDDCGPADYSPDGKQLVLEGTDDSGDTQLFVEQETYPGTPLESVRRDYAYISALEF